jgi:hypothetical protein
MSPSHIRLRFASRQIPSQYYNITPKSLGIRPGHPSGDYIAQQAEEELQACMETARDEMDASQDTLSADVASKLMLKILDWVFDYVKRDVFVNVGETCAALESRLYHYVYNTFPLDSMPRTDRALRS